MATSMTEVAGEAGDGAGERRPHHPQQQKLDYYAPLLSAKRRYAYNSCNGDGSGGGGAGAAEAESEYTAVTGYGDGADSDVASGVHVKQTTQVRTLAGAVPFRWEQSPGRPKNNRYHFSAIAENLDDSSASAAAEGSKTTSSGNGDGDGDEALLPCSSSSSEGPMSVAATASFAISAPPAAASGAQMHMLELVAPIRAGADAEPDSLPPRRSPSMAVTARRRRNRSLPASEYLHHSFSTAATLVWRSATSSPTAAASSSASFLPPYLHNRQQQPDYFRSAIAVADPPPVSGESTVSAESMVSGESMASACAFTENFCVAESPVRACEAGNRTPTSTNVLRAQALSPVGRATIAGEAASGRSKGSEEMVQQKRQWRWRQRSWVGNCGNDEAIGASIVSWERLSPTAQGHGTAAALQHLPPPPPQGQIQAVRRAMAQILSKATHLMKKSSASAHHINGRFSKNTNSNALSALNTIIHCNKQSNVDIVVVDNSSKEAAAFNEVRAILQQRRELLSDKKKSSPSPDMAIHPSVAQVSTTSTAKLHLSPPDASTDDADDKTGSVSSSSYVDGHESASDCFIDASQEMESSSASDGIAQRTHNVSVSSPSMARMNSKLSNLSKRVGKVLWVDTRGLNTVAESDTADQIHGGMIRIKDAEEQYYKALQIQHKGHEIHHANNTSASVPPVFPAKCQKNTVNIDQLKAADVGWPLGISGCPPPTVLKSSSSSTSSSSSSPSLTQHNGNDQYSRIMPVVSQNHPMNHHQNIQLLVPLPPPLPPSPAGGSWLKKALSSTVSLMGSSSEYSASNHNSPLHAYKLSPVSAAAHHDHHTWYDNKWEVMVRK